MSVVGGTVVGMFGIDGTHPFLAEISANVDDIAADAIVEALSCGGVERISMSTVARSEGRTPAAINQRHGGRAAFLSGVVCQFSVRWVRWIRLAGFLSVVPIRLPEDERELLGVRAWPMLRALAEGEARAGRPACAAHVAWALAEERDHIARHLAVRLGGAPSSGQLEVLVALADGLRNRVAALESPLALEEARELLRHHITSVFDLPLEELDHDRAEHDEDGWYGDLSYM
jgi:hypothetical protein